ncbi:MAG: hypothetical protein AAF549_08920 [Pseudomonadota bacterium]
MSLLSSSRCILLMGDEGLQVFNAGSIGTKLVEFVPWSNEDFIDTVQRLIQKKCGKKPVVILNDMVEQHYRKERIADVNMADRKSILQNRLNFAFPNYRVRAALKLNKKLNPGAEGTKETPYLFAAIPKSDAFNKTMNAVFQSGAPIVGFYLLPVEATALVNELSNKYHKSKTEKKSHWSIFLGQQHNGGLRQVVTKGGELALTRMTPIVDTDVEPALWSRELSEELTSTMSYLARFGYKKEDGLSIFITANDECNDTLLQLINIDADINILSVHEVAKTLGAKVGKHAEPRYTDPLYASYIGKKKKFILPMQSDAIEQYVKPRKIASFVLGAALLAVLYTGYTAFTSWTEASQVNEDISITKQQLQTQENEYNRQISRSKEMGFDFLVVEGALNNHKKLQREKLEPIPVVKEIGRSLGIDLEIEKIAIKAVENKPSEDDFSYRSDEPDPFMPKSFEAVVTLKFPSDVVPEVGVREVESLASRLRENLPDYQIDILKQVADLSYTGNFVGGVNDFANQNNETEQDFNAEIRISERPQ